MRNRPTALGLCSVAVIAGLSLPAAAHAAPTATNYVSGSGDIGYADVSFNAHNTAPTGTAAVGRYTESDPLLMLTGAISCLNVQGKRAGFITTLDKDSTPAVFEGKSLLVTIDDTTPGANSKFGMTMLPAGADMTSCPPGATQVTTTNGHFTVRQVKG